MKSKTETMRLDSIAFINPRRSVKKGSDVAFIEMAALPQHSRDISPKSVEIRKAKSSGAHFINGDTLLARITPCLENGKTALVDCLNEDSVGEGSTEFIVLCGKDKVDNDFIYYLCRDPAFREFAISRMEGTSGRQRVSWQSIAAFEFTCPEQPYRTLAASILSSIDDRIRLLKEANETLEAVAEAIYKSWFIDFEYKKIEKGKELPNDWSMSTVENVFDLTMGQSPPGETYNSNGEGIAFYQGRTEFGFRFPTLRMHCTAPTRFAEKGDTLVSVRAPVGDVNMAIEKCCIGRGLAALRHKKYKSFTYYTARSLKTHFSNFDSEGTIFGSINKKAFQSLPVVLPTEKVLDQFENIAQPIDSKIALNEEQTRTFEELRDTLLPRLVRGELDLTCNEVVGALE